MSMSDNTKKTRHIQDGRKMIFSKKAKHTCTSGGEVGHQQPRFGALQATLPH